MSGALMIAEQRPAVKGRGVANPGVSTQVLTKYMAPLRAGDPLGLGGVRPQPPQDPDPYDRATEDEQYSRSILSAGERETLNKTIEKEGFMSIDAVRQFIGDNASAALTEISGLDPEMIILLDTRINYKIFVADGNVYTRDELFNHFAFHELDTQPEAVFTQQEIGLFPADLHSLTPDEFSYVARDVGDESIEFITVEDMVGLAARKNYKMKRELVRAVKTKVYIGKEPWEDFKAMQQLMRGAVRIARTHCANGGNGPNIFAALLGGGMGPSPKLLTDPETLEIERRAREEADAQREKELREREEELRKREEEVQRRIDADIARLERMFASKGLAAAAKMQSKKAPTTPAAAKSAAVSTPVKSAPVKSAPVKSAPAKGVATKSAPAVKIVTPLSVPSKAPAKTAASADSTDYSALFAEMFPDGDSVSL